MTGCVGKSLVVETMQKRYKDSRVYSYDNYTLPVKKYYYVYLDECTIDEFCEFVYQDISKIEKEVFPISIVIIYTNLDDIKAIENLANRLESENLVRMAVVTGR